MDDFLINESPILSKQEGERNELAQFPHEPIFIENNYMDVQSNQN
jgi:hypothetical protein